MSVIAKLRLDTYRPFGTGAYVHLTCVAENETMAAYNPTEEDRLFTRASPSGEIALHEREGWAVFGRYWTPEVEAYEHVPSPTPPPRFYAMVLAEDEVSDPTFPGACAFLKINCYAITKFQPDGIRIDLREVRQPPGQDAREVKRADVIEKLSWRMSIDNPAAERQFVPARQYWLAFYKVLELAKDEEPTGNPLSRGGLYTMREAIAAAHGHDA